MECYACSAVEYLRVLDCNKDYKCKGRVCPGCMERQEKTRPDDPGMDDVFTLEYWRVKEKDKFYCGACGLVATKYRKVDKEGRMSNDEYPISHKPIVGWLYKRETIRYEKMEQNLPTFRLDILPRLEAKMDAAEGAITLGNKRQKKLHELDYLASRTNQDKDCVDRQAKVRAELFVLSGQIKSANRFVREFDAKFMPLYSLSNDHPVPNRDSANFLQQLEDAQKTVGKPLEANKGEPEKKKPGRRNPQRDVRNGVFARQPRYTGGDDEGNDDTDMEEDNNDRDPDYSQPARSMSSG